jgi:signal transduction histidine kinase
LADRELEGALRRLTADFAATPDVTIAIDIDPTTAALLSPIAADIVQIAREALSNRRRHSGASTVRLTLTRADTRAVLEIMDDGRGLEPGAQRGQGLDNMQARAGRLGGEFLISPLADQCGTVVRLAIPL